MRVWVLAALIVTSLACAPTMAERESLLAEYRRALDRVPVEHDVPKPVGDPNKLVGLPREKIRQALGAPTEECDGKGGPFPCQGRGDWFYSFYELPPDTDGGGLELLLRFDDAGKCTEARWEESE